LDIIHPKISNDYINPACADWLRNNFQPNEKPLSSRGKSCKTEQNLLLVKIKKSAKQEKYIVIIMNIGF